MYKSKLLILLKTLDKKEMRRFGDYVHSPYFNKHEKTKLLYDEILIYAPDYNHKGLEKKKVYKKLFAKTGNIQNLNYVISNLQHLLTEFIVLQRFEQDEVYNKQILLNELLKKEQFYLFDKYTDQLEEFLEDTPIRNADYYFNLYRLHELKNNYFIKQTKRAYHSGLQLMSDNLDIYYWASKLRLAANIMSRNSFVEKASVCHFIDEVIAYIEQHPLLLEVPILYLNYKELQFLKSEDKDALFIELKHFILTNVGQFSIEELNPICIILLNFCIKKINTGHREFYNQSLEWYKFMLLHEVIIINSQLEKWHYKNIVTIGIRAKELHWTEQFIHQYITFLPEKEQTRALAYNLASFYYAIQDYNKALQQLNFIEFSDPSYHIGAKIIQLKSYFELNETELFYALVEAFKKYLRRNSKLTKYHKLPALNFVQISKKLFDLEIIIPTISTAELIRRIKYIEDKINTLSSISNKDWLLDRLENIKAKQNA